MRSLSLPSVLSFVLVLGGAGACAAPASDGAGEEDQNVTGGSASIESPVAFLFDDDGAAAPRCAGAMLADNLAVTAKACAKVGLVVGRAADKDGHGARRKVTAVHVPEAKDADIAVVELDKPLPGAIAVITHMPLRSGYAVNAFAAVKGKGLFGTKLLAPDANTASTVKATMTEETETHGSMLPVKGAQICDGDVGAPVCTSTGAKILGHNLFGTCGLAGLVVSRMATPEKDAKPGCSGEAWKVVQLGQHHAFLSKLAPKAFEPWRIDRPLIRHLSFAPDGLWGYQTKGDVKACTLNTVALEKVAPGAPSVTLSAKVSFANMDKKAEAWGRFGIAPKSAPTKMRWLAATTPATKGGAFEATFEGIVNAEAPGDYIVAFRATANGGESWTPCDTDGIANGFSAGKTLALTVAADAPDATPPNGAAPTGEPARTDPAPKSEGEQVAPAPGASSDPLPDFAPKKKDESAKDESGGAGGCSIASTPRPSSKALAVALGALGILALGRRRRRRPLARSL